MGITKIILMKGGVETLDYFSKQMGDYYESKGLAVFYFDLKNTADSVKHVKRFLKTGETILVTFNFEGLEREDDLFTLREGYLWNQYRIPIYNIAADHPYFYDNRFRDLREDEADHPGLLDLYHHLSIDRNHREYLRIYYPEFADGGFLPLAGTNPFPGQPLKPMADRSIDLVFTGNYTVPSRLESNINWINEEYATFYTQIIDDVLSHPDRTIDEIEVEHCEEEMGYNPPEDLAPALHKMMFIDLYARNYYRGRVVASLVNAGFAVTVIGRGWEDLEVKSPNRLTILPQTDSLSCLQAIRDAKVSLNVMPWFKDGSHDRVWNSLLNGAVCLSDPSLYQQEVLPEGCGIRYYSLQDSRQLIEKLTELLSNVSLLQQLSDEGRPIAEADHTWAKRAETILAFSEGK